MKSSITREWATRIAEECRRSEGDVPLQANRPKGSTGRTSRASLGGMNGKTIELKAGGKLTVSREGTNLTLTINDAQGRMAHAVLDDEDLDALGSEIGTMMRALRESPLSPESRASLERGKGDARAGRTSPLELPSDDAKASLDREAETNPKGATVTGPTAGASE
jgi:hypothetical protein